MVSPPRTPRTPRTNRGQGARRRAARPSPNLESDLTSCATQKAFGEGFQRRHLLCCGEVPEYQRELFIHTGYRPTPPDTKSLILTLFSIHNETGNIWTHLLPFGYFAHASLQLCCDVLGPLLTGDGAAQLSTDMLLVLALLLATSCCLLCSSAYHLCCCADDKGCMLGLDRAGIVVLIGTSFFTGVALAYRCHPLLRCAYLLLSAAIVATLASALTWIEDKKKLRACLIACVGLGLLPAGHFALVGSPVVVASFLPYLMLMFIFYGAGAVFFVSRWPECQWPGRFDIVGHSHQLWHIFVLLAAGTWVHGCDAMARFYLTMGCEA